MNNRLLTLLEIAVIVGLIIFVMYLGGVFKPEPGPTPTLLATVRVITATPTASDPTRTPHPTPAASPTPPTGLIAFNATRDGNTEIYVVDVQAMDNPRNLTNYAAEDYLLAWSPDGARLAFFSTRTQWLELYVMDADGSNVIQLTDTKASNTAYDWPVAWSPDGNFIVAARSTPWPTEDYNNPFFLDLISTDGAGATHIYRSDSALWNIGFSPDSQYLAIGRIGRDGSIVYVGNVEENPLDLNPIMSCFEFAWMRNTSQLTCNNGGDFINLNPDGSHAYRIEANDY